MKPIDDNLRLAIAIDTRPEQSIANCYRIPVEVVRAIKLKYENDSENN